MTWVEKATSLRAKIEQASAWTDDADALEMVELFPRWTAERSVIPGERLQYDGVLYKCLQAHTTQADWTPDVTTALWTAVSVEEYPAWKQPSGSADAYRLGDKVSHNDKHWVCTSDYTIYAPGVFGWEAV